MNHEVLKNQLVALIALYRYAIPYAITPKNDPDFGTNTSRFQTACSVAHSAIADIGLQLTPELLASLLSSNEKLKAELDIFKAKVKTLESVSYDQQEAEIVIQQLKQANNTMQFQRNEDRKYISSLESQLAFFEKERAKAAAWEKEEPIMGQQCVCPDGLGRVIETGEYHPGGAKWIRVSTFINDRGRKWDILNVKLVPIHYE